MSQKVAIIMGSQSDWPVMEGAATALKSFQVDYAVEVISAHRTPEKMVEFAKTAQEKGFEVIIAGAGGSAHLPGMVASMTTLPVIGVPVKLKNLNGLDSLLSIVQMPKGIPVATVAVDNSYNAGLLAARIIGCKDKEMSKKLQAFQNELKVKVEAMNEDLKKEL